MSHDDLIAVAAQTEGHVSEDTRRLADRIYDPGSGRAEHEEAKTRLRKVAAATRSLQHRRSRRYLQRKAVRKLERKRAASA